MAEIVKVRGVTHDKSQYKRWSLAKFSEVFMWQAPYRDLQPKQRDEALNEDYVLLVGRKSKTDDAEKE
jgi:hypothetical protein